MPQASSCWPEVKEFLLGIHERGTISPQESACLLEIKAQLEQTKTYYSSAGDHKGVEITEGKIREIAEAMSLPIPVEKTPERPEVPVILEIREAENAALKVVS